MGGLQVKNWQQQQQQKLVQMKASLAAARVSRWCQASATRELKKKDAQIAQLQTELGAASGELCLYLMRPSRALAANATGVQAGSENQPARPSLR